MSSVNVNSVPVENGGFLLVWSEQINLLLAGDQLLCLVLGKRIQKNIIISGSTISSSIIVPCSTLYSPLLQHHLFIFVFVYIILLKVVSIVLHLQLSGSSSSPGSFRGFQRAALQAGHLWGSHKGAGNRPKKCGFTARFLEKRWNMINPRPGMKLFSIWPHVFPSTTRDELEVARFEMCATQFLFWNPSQKMLNGLFSDIERPFEWRHLPIQQHFTSTSYELRVFVWAVGSTRLSLQIESFRMKDDPKLTKFNNTSSTAQGGGGSFKNRKPIGELGCCESGMAERIHWWTERCLRSPLFLSLFLTIYLSIDLSICLSIDLSIYLSALSIFLSISLSLSFISLSV